MEAEQARRALERSILGTPYLTRHMGGFGPRFLGRNLRPSSPSSQIMKLSLPNGGPVRSHRRKASSQAWAGSSHKLPVRYRHDALSLR